MFLKSCSYSSDFDPNNGVAMSVMQLETADYWRTESELDCWLINGVTIKQTPDGFVT